MNIIPKDQIKATYEKLKEVGERENIRELKCAVRLPLAVADVTGAEISAVHAVISEIGEEA